MVQLRRSRTVTVDLAPKKRSGANLKNPDLDFLKKKKNEKKESTIKT